jgi:hypothetical protein
VGQKTTENWHWNKRDGSSIFMIPITCYWTNHGFFDSLALLLALCSYQSLLISHKISLFSNSWAFLQIRISFCFKMVQITPLKCGQSSDNPLNYFGVQFTTLPPKLWHLVQYIHLALPINRWLFCNFVLPLPLLLHFFSTELLI